jgi:hypothetical protein
LRLIVLRPLGVLDPAGQSEQCRLCNLLAENRIKPGSIRPRSHCLRNSSWAGNKQTSWTDQAMSLERAQRVWGKVVGAVGAGAAGREADASLKRR